MAPKGGITWFKVYILPEELVAIKKRDSFLYIYGQIDYCGISSEPKYTRFCKLYWIPFDLVNDATDEGFVDSDVIPPAYTEAT